MRSESRLQYSADIVISSWRHGGWTEIGCGTSVDECGCACLKSTTLGIVARSTDTLFWVQRTSHRRVTTGVDGLVDWWTGGFWTMACNM